MGHSIPDGKGHMTDNMIVNIDHLEVSPDGKWLYFEPVGGPLSRVPTSLLVSNVAASGPWPLMQLCKEEPPGVNPAAFAS